MKTAFIIHGSNGGPNLHWYPWLKAELEKRGFKVILPKFPIYENQTLENWLKALKPFKKELEDSIMIGHSLGASFIIDVLNLWDVKLKLLFLPLE
ncbi:MAG: alpha/beta hydrolase [Candidatus Woesearchaeota archaeon]|nr:MAG: alpha/beta hydrolase [Candidatus Woesearchaeota archaeon]